jgi:hypothetical protein
MITPHTSPLGCYLSEVRIWLATSASKLRSTCQFAPLARVSVAQDIAADAITASDRASATAHRAETLDREADRLISAAQAPASPGGSDITPDEARPICRLILRSAELDHDLSEALHVPAPLVP